MSDRGNNNGGNKDRRRLLKALATSTGAAATVKLAPDKWTKPVVDSVILPAHAQVTPIPDPGPPLANFTINCDSINNGLTCQLGPGGGLIVEIDGDITGSGPDLTGAALDISFEAITSPPVGSGGRQTAITQTTVQAGGSFSESFEVIPPLGGIFVPPGTVDISFNDPATFGTATCTFSWTCGP